MKNRAKSLLKYFYSYTALLFLFFTLLFLGVNFYNQHKELEEASIRLRENHLAHVKNTLRWEVEHFIELINYKKNRIETQEKEFLKKHVYEAHTTAQHIYDYYKASKSTKEIQGIIKEALRPKVFRENGYYFIIDIKTGKTLLNSADATIEGKNILRYKNSRGIEVGQQMINKVKAEQETFYEYFWTKPGQGAEEYAKLSYLKIFEPYGWAIGSGVYVDDIRSKTQQEVLENIEQMKFDPNSNNYIFIGQWNGLSLSYPTKGKNMYDVQDKNGLYIVRELIKTSKEGGGFVEYVMPSLQNERNSLKLSYTQGIDDWGWYVGAGLYVDDINEDIEALEKKMHKEFISTISLTTLLALVSFGLFIFFVRGMNKKIKDHFEVFKEFFNTLVHQDRKIDAKKLEFKEFKVMAEHANQMLKDKVELQDYLTKYKRIVSTSKDFLALVDKNYIYLAVNDTYAKYFQKNREEIEGFSGKELFGEEVFTNQIKPLQDRAIAGESFVVEQWVDFSSGKRFLQTQYSPIKNKNGEVDSIVIATRDITDKKLDAEKLKQWATVFQNTSEAVMICDLDTNIINVNSAFEKITGYSKEEAIGKKSNFINYDVFGNEDFTKVCQLLHEKGNWSGEVRNRKKHGEVYPAYFSGNSVLDDEGNVSNYIAVFSDISDLKESETKLEFLAHHDVLTKLPNRILLNDRVSHAIKVARREKSKLAVCFIDLDNFKKINDSFGHTYGDDILMQVAKRIKNTLREIDTLSRIGGDEFILLLENLTSEDEVRSIIQKVKDSFEEPFIINERKFFISASVGICMYPKDADNVEDLIKNSDIAMYQAKDAGKNTYKFFTEDMFVGQYKKLDIESSLKDAIANNEFMLYYQPQISLRTKKCVGFEALIRWKHPEKGLISPLDFIPLAEETKMIIPIGEFVMRQSCKDLKRLQEEFGFKGRASINISGVQIEHSDLSQTIESALTDSNIEASKIELEVTESVIMNNPVRWIELLNEIRATGVKTAIDDFGTGYSSLNYLRRLPIDKLKIDMSFVRDIPNQQDACAVVNSIMDLAKNMKMLTLAEGIENKEQEEYLELIGCEEGQGYLYSKPVPFDELSALLGKGEL